MPSGVSHGSGTASAVGTAASVNAMAPKFGIWDMSGSIAQGHRHAHYRFAARKRPSAVTWALVPSAHFPTALGGPHGGCEGLQSHRWRSGKRVCTDTE